MQINYLYIQVACLLSFWGHRKPVFAVTALALQSIFKKSTEVVPADGSRDHRGQTFVMTRAGFFNSVLSLGIKKSYSVFQKDFMSSEIIRC